jgi:hypothetical protein
VNFVWTALWVLFCYLAALIFCRVMGGCWPWQIPKSEKPTSFREQLDRLDADLDRIDHQFQLIKAIDWPYVTYMQIAEGLRPEIRNAIEAAVAVPDPPPIELTRGEKLVIGLQAECDHIWHYDEAQILSHGQRLVRSEQLRTCLVCSHSDRLLGPLQARR